MPHASNPLTIRRGTGRPLLLAALAFALAGAWPAAAQQERGLPARPLSPQVARIGSDTYLVTSAANERGNSLWVVDPVQHTVTLCVQNDGAREFRCAKQPLP